MSPFRLAPLFAVSLTALLGTASAADDPNPFSKHAPAPIVGRWDLKVRAGDLEYPSWLEVRLSGYRTLVGTYVGRFGSGRPVAEVKFEEGRFRFALPPQWERRSTEIVHEGTLEGDVLRGETTGDKGNKVTWEGRRAPSLDRAQEPKWGAPVELFNGKDLAGWTQRFPNVNNGWIVRDGALVNDKPGNDLMTEQKYNDFKLHAEFRYPKGSNSGIYLRGRYEVQVEDNYGQEPESHKIGGVYGFLTPSINAAKPAGEWQTIDIMLVGRAVTIVLNGERVIDRQTIPGITGGAIDSDEAAPGPLLLQGDHGPVEFRKVTITPGQ